MCVKPASWLVASENYQSFLLELVRSQTSLSADLIQSLAEMRNLN